MALGKFNPKKLKGTIKKGMKTAGRTISTGTSPVTYIPRTAAGGYKSTTKALKNIRRRR